MTFSIIGTGNIAWFLGNRLVAGRHNCVGVYARKKENARELAGALIADNCGAISDIKDGDADICFLVVSDMAIGSVATQLSFRNTVLVHTAGAVSLDSIKQAAADRAVLWPVYSIIKNNLPTHRNIPCAWEASTVKAEKYILSICHAVTDVLFEAKYDQRKWLHLTAVISNNFINHLMAIGERVCEENQLPFSTLQPILEQTFDRIKQASPKDLQTGPAIRRDATTIQEHIRLLSTHPNWQRVYEAITESIQTEALFKQH